MIIQIDVDELQKRRSRKYVNIIEHSPPIVYRFFSNEYHIIRLIIHVSTTFFVPTQSHRIYFVHDQINKLLPLQSLLI